MTDPYEVSADEHGIVRVFTTDMEPEGASAVTPQNVEKLLGDGVSLDPEKVQVVPSKILEGMGLTGYLREGYGVAEADMEGKRAALDALSGLVILIPTSAFKGETQTLSPHDGLRFIGAFKEQRGAPSRHMQEAATAKGSAAFPEVEPVARPEPARIGSWMIAAGALLIAAMLVLLFAF